MNVFKDIPNCYHFGANASFVRSPKIPVVLEGVRVPMIIDTGAEVSILSTKFMQDLFSNHELPLQGREVRSLGGGLVRIQGPIMLTVEVCNLVLQHPFYYYDGNTTFLMGYDLISAAALTIDSESRCVWSNHTLRQDPANTYVKQTIEGNVDPFLETVPRSYCSSSGASEESMETQIPGQSLYASSSLSHPHSSLTFYHPIGALLLLNRRFMIFFIAYFLFRFLRILYVLCVFYCLLPMA